MTSSTKEPFKKLSIFDLARGYEQADRSDRNYARHHFNDHFTYRDVTPCDITALEGYISIEIAAFRAIGEVTVPELSVSHYRKTRPIIHMGDAGGIREAFLFCDGSYFNGREAISFNEDGFIGFCGWADSMNSRPFVSGFCRWVDEWMTPAKSLRAMRND